MPVLSVGYVIGLYIFRSHPLTLNQTGFLTLTQKLFYALHSEVGFFYIWIL